MVLSGDSTDVSVTFNDKLSDSEVLKLPLCYKNLGEAFYRYIPYAF